MTQLEDTLKINLKQIKDVCLQLIPRSKQEWGLFIGFSLLYASYSFIFLFHTSIVDNISIPVDTYFSFDTPSIYHTGYQSVPPHPLMRYITAPFLFLGNCLEVLFNNYKAKTLFLGLLCIILVSLSNVYIYRYLRKVISLGLNISLLLTLFYAFTSTNLVLPFTPESYTISLFLLTFIIYYYSYCIKENKGVTFLSNLSFTVLLGGVTITNAAMGVIPMFFTKDKFKHSLKKLSIIIFCVGLIILWVHLQNDFILDVKKRLLWLTYMTFQYYEHAIDLYVGAPVLFPEIKVGMHELLQTNVIVTDVYRSWWQYTFIGILFFLMILSLGINYKNKYLQMLALFYGLNLFIHLIIKYGINEPLIYGAHWIYIIPIFLGWLYKSLKKESLKKMLFLLISLLFVVMLVNNVIRMIDFANLSLAIFPAY